MEFSRIKEIAHEYHLTMSKDLAGAMTQAAYEEGQAMKDLYLAILHKWEFPGDVLVKKNRGE